MKLFLNIAIITNLTLSCFGQFTPTDLPFLSAKAASTGPTYVDPSGSNTLFEWWSPYDLTNSAIVYMWTGRIRGITWTNRSAAASQSANSLLVNNSSTLYTNDPAKIIPGSNSTMAIIIKPSLVNVPAAVIIGTTDGSPFNEVFLDNANLKFPFGTTIGTRAANVTFDLVISTSNTVNSIWTNGVFAKNVTLAPPATGFTWLVLCKDSTSDAVCQGNYYDILIWSNVFTSFNYSNFHYFSTNSSGAAPFSP